MHSVIYIMYSTEVHLFDDCTAAFLYVNDQLNDDCYVFSDVNEHAVA